MKKILKPTRNILWIIFGCLLLSSVSLAYGKRSLSVDPSSLVSWGGTVNTGETITVNVTVTDVGYLYNWQVRIYFDNSLINCTDAYLPPGNAFDGMSPIWAKDIKNDHNVTHGYVQCGASVIPMNVGTANVTGVGTLCKINFTAGEEIGISPLEFSEPYSLQGDTFLVYVLPPNYMEEGLIDLDEITDGDVEVVPEFPLFITPLFMIATIVVIVLLKKGLPKKRLVIR